MKKLLSPYTISTIALLLMTAIVQAQGITGIWYNEEKNSKNPDL